MSRVYLRGGTWCVDFRDERGERVRQALEGVTGKREAEAELAELVAAARRRRMGLEAAPATARSTVWELCEWWLTKRCPAASAEIERGRLEKHVQRSALGRKLVAHARAEDFEALFAELERPALPSEARRQLAGGSINHLRAKLRTVFERARREGIYHRANPVADTRKRKPAKMLYETVTADELDQVLRFIAPQWRNFVAATLYLALRKGEAAGALKTDVDLARGLIRIGRSYERDTTKGGHQDVLPIPRPMLPYLEAALKTPGPFLFPQPSGAMVHRGMDPHLRLRTALGRAGLVYGYQLWCWHCSYSRTQPERADKVPCPVCAAARSKKVASGAASEFGSAVASGAASEFGSAVASSAASPPLRRSLVRYLRVRPLPRHVRLHDLRHSAATILLRAGADPHRVQKLLRHADVSTTTGTYGHLVVEDLRAAQAAFEPGTNPAHPPPPRPSPPDGGSSEVSNPTAKPDAIPARFERATPGFGGRRRTRVDPAVAERLLPESPDFEALKEGSRAVAAVSSITEAEVEAQSRHRFAATGTESRRPRPFRGGMLVDEG